MRKAFLFYVGRARRRFLPESIFKSFYFFYRIIEKFEAVILEIIFNFFTVFTVSRLRKKKEHPR